MPSRAGPAVPENQTNEWSDLGFVESDYWISMLLS